MVKISGLWKVALGVAVLGLWAQAFAQDAGVETRKAQNKLLAYRAARSDAIRKLAERIQGLRLNSETTVQDFVTTSDVIRSEVTAVLAGAHEVGKPKYAEDGTCEVSLEVPLVTVIEEL